MLEAENVALRQQIVILRRRAPQQLTLNRHDRLLFSLIYRLFPGILAAIQIVRPEPVIHLHRMGFKALWRWKSRPRGGRPAVSKEIREFIRNTSLANPLWGAPRIHGELKCSGSMCHNQPLPNI